jgi:hypothetical protein
MSAVAGMRPSTTSASTGASGKAPPAFLPGEHFAAALFFLLGGCVALAWSADEIARGTYLAPGVAATTHLFTLGWITTSIMGALYQFLPVALDEPIGSIRVAHTSFVLYVPGLLLFEWGLVGSHRIVLVAGAATFGSGLLLFIGNMAATLNRAARRDLTWFALAIATFFLAVTLVLGGRLAGNVRSGILSADKVHAMHVHLHVAIAGWVLMVMIGVAHRLLPMFLLSHGVKSHYAKAAVGLIAAGAAALAFLSHATPIVSVWLPAVCLTLGCIAFLLQGRSFFHHRHRRALDPGMRLAAAGLALLLIAIVLGWAALLMHDPAMHAHVSVAYISTLLMSITLFVAAHHYKIVPFLIWYHRFGPLAGRQRVPRVAELYSPTLANAAVAMLATGAMGFCASVASGLGAIARVFAFIMLGGAIIEATQMLKLWRLRP